MISLDSIRSSKRKGVSEMKEKKYYPTQEVYKRSGEVMELLLKVAPKMLSDERYLFKGDEMHGLKKENRKAA